MKNSEELQHVIRVYNSVFLVILKLHHVQIHFHNRYEKQLFYTKYRSIVDSTLYVEHIQCYYYLLMMRKFLTSISTSYYFEHHIR